jgi:hypothetical protein
MSKILTRWPADAADCLLAADSLFVRDSEEDEEEDDEEQDDDRDENEEEDIDDDEDGYSE